VCVCVCVCNVIIEEGFSLFQISSYLSNIGGVLGLWIGVSFLTFGEFVEFVLDLCVYTATKYVVSRLKAVKWWLCSKWCSIFCMAVNSLSVFDGMSYFSTQLKRVPHTNSHTHTHRHTHTHVQVSTLHTFSLASPFISVIDQTFYVRCSFPNDQSTYIEWFSSVE